jgi:hypothetical protein
MLCLFEERGTVWPVQVYKLPGDHSRTMDRQWSNVWQRGSRAELTGCEALGSPHIDQSHVVRRVASLEVTA